MSTNDETQAQLRLLQFLSPALPVGSYSFSQGLEWAVEQNWIVDESSFRSWIEAQIASTLSEQELPLLARLYRSVREKNIEAFTRWSQLAIAVRDTAEFRREERSRAQAYLRVLEAIESIDDEWPRLCFLQTPFASMAWFSVKHNISEHALLGAYAHNWLESSLVTGIKIIPLGQTSGQKLLFELSATVMAAISRSLTVDDDCVGISLPALSMASCGHEVQYSRVYRS